MRRTTAATLAAVAAVAAVALPSAASAATRTAPPPKTTTGPTFAERSHTFTLPPSGEDNWTVPLAAGEEIISYWSEDGPGTQLSHVDGIHGVGAEQAPGTPAVVGVANTDPANGSTVVFHYMVLSGASEVVVP
jgi:ABC-type glycerol-3-phosphate transport system substrate-binding protein